MQIIKMSKSCREKFQEIGLRSDLIILQAQGLKGALNMLVKR